MKAQRAGRRHEKGSKESEKEAKRRAKHGDA